MFFNKNKKIVCIDGMKCNHCASKVENALSSIEGVSKVKVSLDKKQAVVTYKDTLNDEDVKRKINELDFNVTDIKEK